MDENKFMENVKLIKEHYATMSKDELVEKTGWTWGSCGAMAARLRKMGYSVPRRSRGDGWGEQKRLIQQALGDV